jgi:hypothetical protein
MKLTRLAAAATVAMLTGLPAMAQPTVIGNVCGVPVWHHGGGQVLMFTVKPMTNPLPGNLTPQSLYFIPMPSTSFPSVGYGTIAAAVDVEIRQALGQVGCFDVTTEQFTTDDGTGNRAIDHDVPVE